MRGAQTRAWQQPHSSGDILDFLRPRVAKFWLPDAVVFLEAVPKTSVGKFNKKVLRERFKEW
jgi:acyl-CoA synthetase (AMP-forming)/AMP-acid ligase II